MRRARFKENEKGILCVIMSLVRQEMSVLLLTVTVAACGVTAYEHSEREFNLLDTDSIEVKDVVKFAMEAAKKTAPGVSVLAKRAELTFQNLQYRLYLDLSYCDETGSCDLRDCFAHVIQPTQYPEWFLKEFSCLRPNTAQHHPASFAADNE
ncbi:uncharacterized protein LOC135371650 [Ornithodoros turicata]|uniref:uncharacterized protein LOC135371650 n=1 Tax=Ornithodoros turicata TaxID=34597 RepID=UPI0031392A25